MVCQVMSSCCASWSLPAARRPMAWRSVHFCVFSLISLKVVNLIINHSKKMWRAFRIFRVLFGRERDLWLKVVILCVQTIHMIFFRSWRAIITYYTIPVWKFICNVVDHTSSRRMRIMMMMMLLMMIPDFNLFGWRWSHQHSASRHIIPELVWRNTYSNPVH